MSFEQEEEVGGVMPAYNPGICEVDAEDLKLKASLGYTSSPHLKEQETSRDTEGCPHEGNVTTWQQGQRLRQGIHMPRSMKGGGHEEMGEEP